MTQIILSTCGSDLRRIKPGTAGEGKGQFRITNARRSAGDKPELFLECTSQKGLYGKPNLGRRFYLLTNIILICPLDQRLPRYLLIRGLPPSPSFQKCKITIPKALGRATGVDARCRRSGDDKLLTRTFQTWLKRGPGKLLVIRILPKFPATTKFPVSIHQTNPGSDLLALLHLMEERELK
jgi:hypothetical protein